MNLAAANAEQPTPGSLQPQGRERPWWVWMIFRVFGLLLVILIMFGYFQRSLIYFPSRDLTLSQTGTTRTNSLANISLVSHDHKTLHGWLAPAHLQGFDDHVDPRQLVAQPQPLVIIFPGNAGNRSNRLELIRILRALGADSLIFDCRGYGDNEGSPSEAEFIRDAHSIWNYVTCELNVPANRIVLYGESLGGGTATRLAGELGKEGIEPGGLILQSTFNSLVETGRYHFPILPVSLLLIDRFESQKHIVNVKSPILQLHGLQDTVVPVSLGKKLFDAAPATSVSGIAKEQVLLPNANHNDVFDADEVPATAAIRKFLLSHQERLKPATSKKPPESAE